MDRLKKVVGIDDYDRIVFEDGSTLVANASKISIGKGTYLSPGLQIGLEGKQVEEFVVGDNCRIFAGKIAPRSFVCGDYVTIHEGVWCYGRNDVKIGHNAWFGMRCTLDAEGKFTVGNGFGAGQDTHLWSHIRHGDVLVGSQYLSFGEFVAGDDVWFVGRCTSSPVVHENFSVALTESNVTKGMGFNTVWGGNPAKDLTEKIGTPYRFTTPEERRVMFGLRVLAFSQKWPGVDINSVADTFDVDNRTYEKTNSSIEVAFMRFLLPEMKFTPR